MYLSQPAIERTLEAIRSLGSTDATLLVTYFERGHQPFATALTALLERVREPVRSAFSPPEIRALFADHGFQVVEDSGDPEWSPRYLGRSQSWSLERLARANRS